MTTLRDDLVRAFALALHLPEETFASQFGESMSNMSLLYYPPNPDSIQITREHHDTNALTILLPSPVGGLEVLHRDGRWIEAPPLDGCFVVNIANQMECWSGGRFRSTMHRVKPPAGTDLYSIGYFAAPNYDTMIEPLPTNAPEARQFDPIHAGRDLAAFVAEFDS